jgi:L-ascorbate oxidase
MALHMLLYRISSHGAEINFWCPIEQHADCVPNLRQSNNLPTGGFDIHPFHAHGGHYWDLGSGNGTYNAAENEKKLAGYNPVKRDTTMLYRYATSGVLNTTAGWRAWRIKVDDTGIWMMHCHILQHMIMGWSTSIFDAFSILQC